MSMNEAVTHQDPQVPSTNSKKDQDKTRWLHKTKLCVYTVQGSCRLGSKCSFAHSVSEVQEAPNLVKTQMCPAYEQGMCFNDNCAFAHSEEELRLSPHFKYKMCKWFGQGKCRNGDECLFAHGKTEMRAQPTRQMEPPPIEPPPGLSFEDERKQVLSLASSLLEVQSNPSLELQVEGMTAQISALQFKMEDMALRSQVSGMKQMLGQLSEQCAMLESQLAQPEPAVPVMPQAPWSNTRTPLKTKLKSNAAPFQPTAFSGQAGNFVPSFAPDFVPYQQPLMSGYQGCHDGSYWLSDESTDVGEGGEYYSD